MQGEVSRALVAPPHSTGPLPPPRCEDFLRAPSFQKQRLKAKLGPDRLLPCESAGTYRLFKRRTNLLPSRALHVGNQVLNGPMADTAETTFVTHLTHATEDDINVD